MTPAYDPLVLKVSQDSLGPQDPVAFLDLKALQVTLKVYQLLPLEAPGCLVPEDFQETLVPKGLEATLVTADVLEETSRG